MAYIGVPPADRTSGARVRDEFTADGTQVCFQLSQEVPGSFESNIIAVVENVIQEPVSAYTIVDTVTVALTSISGTFTKNETITGGTSAATGKVIQVNAGSVVIKVITGTFQAAEGITGGSSSATATISTLTTNIGRGLNFSGTPTSASKIYALHQASATYNLKPAAGSVTPDSLSENLRTFTVDKFTATSSQTAFTLSTAPVSVKSILVFVDGVMQSETTHYTLSGVTLTIGASLTAGQQVTVVHLGFSTVSRTAFVDGSVTTAMLADGSITADKIANGTIIAADVADGAITTAKLNSTLDLSGKTITYRSIVAGDIASNAITNAKIADDAVGIDELSATGTADSTTFLRGDNSWAVVAVTPTAVSDQTNSSTGYFDLPAGTTAQRPGSPTTGASRFNSDLGFAEYWTGTQWATYGNLSVSTISYLIAAGGGGGGGAGGGGAGGVLISTASVTAGTTYTITVGGGGTGAAAGSNTRGANGTNTTAFGLTAVGGGGGGAYNSGSTNAQNGLSGGSGGGGGWWAGGASSAGAGTSGQGFAGGSNSFSLANPYSAGGGGGAGAVGGTTSANNVSGNGGVGAVSSITGTSLYWGGGGGGGGQNGTSGNGGLGGGGGGACWNGGTAGTGGGSALNSGGNGEFSTGADTDLRGGDGGANTGGGGGGMGVSVHTGGAGGSGIVVVSYSTSYKDATATGTFTKTLSGGNQIYTFTGSGTIVF